MRLFRGCILKIRTFVVPLCLSILLLELKLGIICKVRLYSRAGNEQGDTYLLVLCTLSYG